MRWLDSQQVFLHLHLPYHKSIYSHKIKTVFTNHRYCVLATMVVSPQLAHRCSQKCGASNHSGTLRDWNARMYLFSFFHSRSELPFLSLELLRSPASRCVHRPVDFRDSSGIFIKHWIFYSELSTLTVYCSWSHNTIMAAHWPIISNVK